MHHKKIILTETFDPSFFVIGEAYQIYDNENDVTGNYLLNDINGDWITFYDQDGDVLEISLDEYKEKYDILRMVPSSELISVEPVPTISTEPEYMETKDEMMKDFVSDQLMVCREVDYDNLTDRIIFGEDKVDELMGHIFAIDGAINKFYYKISNMLINNGSVCKARYYISLEKLDDSYKLHPAFIESDNDEFTVQFVSSDLIRTSYFGIDNGDDGSDEVVTDTSFNRFKVMIENEHNNTKMWNVEIVSALQLLALVELGFKEANNENTTGKNYHGIKHLFDGYFQFVDGLTIKGNEIKVNGNTVCKTSTIVGGYIRYFKNLPNYDWLFIPNRTIGDYTDSIGCRGCMLNSNTNEYIAYLGGDSVAGHVAGLFCWHLSECPFSSNAYVSTRTMID